MFTIFLGFIFKLELNSSTKPSETCELDLLLLLLNCCKINFVHSTVHVLVFLLDVIVFQQSQ